MRLRQPETFTWRGRVRRSWVPLTPRQAGEAAPRWRALKLRGDVGTAIHKIAAARGISPGAAVELVCADVLEGGR